ncbi:DUF4037 domain-containing protein [Clostridium sp. MCC353]|uniref:DUF4037 domain-containing protein n=1 Tax=Clostridium sp. MCC353 TaxID=2592646 RepID=UPI001C027FD5|nr:DUF4037 domain-containing protein [Clostridium sp. MCC353]
MKGLELARGYYEAYGRSMIHEKFPEYESRIAVGLAGEGSECFGYDDEYSRDHDFGPAFCMWVDREVMEQAGARLQEEYERLPLVYNGFNVRRDHKLGGHRTGVWEITGFYRHFLLVPGVPESNLEWMNLPESYLAAAVNGEVFRDDEGSFTGIRKELQKGYPEDVRIKKMVARAAFMSQSGQYNYPRCRRRGEPAAACLALAEFIKSGMSMIYLLNRRYAPFYKWMHRGLKDLDVLGDTWELFGKLADARTAEEDKQQLIELICEKIVIELKKQNLTELEDPFLQSHLDLMMSKIGDPQIRRMHWLQG